MKLNIPEMEKGILAFWQETNAFQKSLEKNPKDNKFVFYDGPPFATGLPHHGSLLSSVVKDFMPRYKTMRGFHVDRVWGWDCHGLPIENLVEGELGLNSKKDIEELGIDKFNGACRAAVLKYDREWKQYVDRVGRWVDFDNSYKTMDNQYIESVWWGFKQIFDKDLAYEGRHISLYCPRCSTPLSNFEIAMDNSYKDVEDNAIYVQFPVDGEDNTYFVAWTTTPWTMPGHSGLLVQEKADYVKVKFNDAFYYVAKDLVEQVFETQAEVVESLKGSDLIGKTYTPPYNYHEAEKDQKMYFIAHADFVSLEDGSGIVHTAAIHGEDDYRIAKELNLPLDHMLDEAGHFLPKVEKFASKFFKGAEKGIIADLEERGFLLRAYRYTHSYPFCWRCETPLYYNAVPAWFISVTKVKDRMLELNEEINWLPEHLKNGRFKYGLESAPDWNVSRNRYWGAPLPVWQCDKTGEVEVIGSIADLEEKTGKKVEDLHLPNIDEFEWKNEKTGGTMKRVSQVFDCWVESGSMPFASKHYPFENKEEFEANFPGDYIAEYIAQTRGWFYTLHVLSTAIFDKPSFRNVLTTGTIQAEDGYKMSKSKKNYTDPLVLFDQYGADSFRFYLLTSPVMGAENLNFSDDGVKETMRKMVMLLGNIHSFYAMYAGESLQTPSEDELKAMNLTTLDHWLLAKYDELLRHVTTKMDEYDPVRAGRPMMDFVNDFSTWYLRRSRDRFKGDDQEDKQVALAVTRYVLDQFIAVLAPFMPFMTEHINRELHKGTEDSVHNRDWPEAVDWMKNDALLGEMDAVRQIIEVALAARADEGIKVRQACERLLVKLPAALPELKADYAQLIKDEVNVKEVLAVGGIEEQPGYTNREGKNLDVSLKTELTEELLQEGLARDMVRQINNLRKNAGLSIDSRVIVHYQTDSDFVEKVVEAHGEQIAKDTLADGIHPEPLRDEYKTKLKFHEHEVHISIMKV